MNHDLSREETETGKVILEYRESGVAFVWMGTPSERVITLTPRRLHSLRDILEKLRSEKPKGVVFLSPHAEMFTAGAEISIIRDVTDPKTGEQLAREGQAVFDLIESLPFPTVAAISGPCVGGGCEMVLACRFRIMTEVKSSVIGLPEIRLGILPGFGGTQRMPRLIGLPRSLDIILAGKTVKPKQALRAGLVHETVPTFEELKRRAEAAALGTARLRQIKLSPVERVITRFPLARALVAKKARAHVMRETKGFYPAPLKALECILYGLKHGQKAGLEREARELGKLIVTPVSKALVNIFFLTEGAKALGKNGKKEVQDMRAVVVGAGVMGAGIASVLARSECQVILKDTTEKALERGMGQIKEFASKIRSLSESDRSFLVNRVEATTTDSPQIAHAGLAVEAVFEDLNLKKKILGDLARQMPENAIIASNTSSLSISAIAADIPNPERVIGMHFFNPVEKMPLVEIIRGKQTTDKSIIVTSALATKLGKFPIVVEDVPGFLVNRILSPYLVEAACLLQEGYSIQDIDAAALTFGMPMGPIRLLDEVGLDVAAHVSEIMVEGYGERMRGPLFAKAMSALGRHGKKTKKGFYLFEGKETRPTDDIRDVLKIQAAPKSNDAQHITDRLMLALINEAVRCLDEGVAGAPSPEAANQIDLGSVMGFGFPPFRGGVLYYADSVGAKQLLDKLYALGEKHGPRFTAAEGIGKRVSSGRTFHQANV